MKNLIVYYSFTKNNEKLALYLRKQLNCDIVKLETVRKRTGFSILFDLMFGRKPDLKPVPYYLKDYDHVIFLGPIWAGKIAMPLKSFLINEKQNIKAYSFITLCGGVSGQKEKITRELTLNFGKNPVKVVELWINNLLSADKKDTIKSTTGYRIDADGFSPFDSQLKDFIKEENLLKAI
jgi:flavodoxin